MKYIKFHKFLCKYDRNQNIKTDVYINSEKITWIEEAIDDGKRHACIYFEGDDFVNVFEQIEDVIKVIDSDSNINLTNIDENEKNRNKETTDQKIKKIKKSRKRKNVLDRTQKCKTIEKIETNTQEDKK